MPKIKPLGKEAKDKRKAAEVGLNILKEMDKHEMTQKNLADELGISVQCLNAKIWGRYDFKVIELIKIIRILKVSPETINHWIGWQDI